MVYLCSHFLRIAIDLRVLNQYIVNEREREIRKETREAEYVRRERVCKGIQTPYSQTAKF